MVRRRRPGAFARETAALLEAFAAQSAIAIHNACLFKEIEEKSRELEIASQHKSQFVANMSHELRTPLRRSLATPSSCRRGYFRAELDQHRGISEFALRRMALAPASPRSAI